MPFLLIWFAFHPWQFDVLLYDIVSSYNYCTVDSANHKVCVNGLSVSLSEVYLKSHKRFNTFCLLTFSKLKHSTPQSDYTSLHQYTRVFVLRLYSIQKQHVSSRIYIKLKEETNYLRRLKYHVILALRLFTENWLSCLSRY